jgi:energy-coupling factor transporter ATP-binding protein EcfA2
VIREIEIEGFKSIERLKLELGRVTVLIGENGCGKSNILEAIAFASAAYAARLDHEFLAARGIRSTEPRLMRPAFAERPGGSVMRVGVDVFGKKGPLEFQFQEVESPVSRWVAYPSVPDDAEMSATFGVFFQQLRSLNPTLVEVIQKALHDVPALRDYFSDLDRFVVFSPENSALRAFQREGQILPIGINGEGLFAHLRALERAGKANVLRDLNQHLEVIDWFSSFEIPSDLGPGEHRLSLHDRYLSADVLLDQRSANEGFLFLLFYYTLLLSPDTPKFFAIDNIDASLNPRLCARLMKDIVELAKQHDRQVVVTTHNPAVLDGLNLADDEQRLVVVSRTPSGASRVRRVRAPEPIEGAPSQRLSEAFLRGFLGGLPDNF